MEYQLPHALPVQLVPQKVLSLPRANISMRSGPQDTAPGSEVMVPPRFSQPAQTVPFQDRCQSALLVPRINTSKRFAPHDETAGLPRHEPAMEYQGDHA